MRALTLIAALAGPLGALAQTPPAEEPVFEVHLAPMEGAFRPGEPMHVQIAIFNRLDASVDVPVPDDWTDGLCIVGPDGRKIHEAKTDLPSSSKRTLKSGEFFGRRIDIGKLLDVPEDREGIFHLSWASGKNASPSFPIAVMRDWIVRASTNYGDFAFELYPEAAPYTVDHFVQIVRRGLYKNVAVHRVIAGFMMQTGRVSENVPKVRGEIGPGSIHHVEGSVAMARPAEDVNGAASEWYVSFKPQPTLDHGYCVFGRVIEGMDVLHKIENARTDHQECPACGGRPCTFKDGCGKHHTDAPIPENSIMIKNVTLEKRRSP